MSHVLYLILAFSFCDPHSWVVSDFFYKAVEVLKRCNLSTIESPDVFSSFTSVSSWQ